MSKKFTENDRTSCARDDTTESDANESSSVKSITQQAEALKQSVETVENTIDDNAEMDAEEQEILDAETYRWEWSNPDLAKVDSGVRPSDIKQAMLKDVTPELREKIIQITQKQDPWTDIVERSGVTGFSKELALNCFIKSQTEDEIQLGLHSEKRI